MDKGTKQIENVIIIGGGPSGLATSIYNARAGLKPLVIAGSPPGGQLTLTTEVENYPGYPSIMGPELVMKMRQHAEKFGVRFTDENVTKVEFAKGKNGIHKLSTPSAVHEAKTVIITTGAKALWLGLESEQRLRGKGVSACATCDGFFFRNKTVAVVGGGDTAMEEALTLTKFASKVYLIHRRNEFRASKIMQERVLNDKKVQVLWNTTVEEVLGEKKVEGLRLKKIVQSPQGSNAKNNTATEHLNNDALTVDGLFLAIGHKPDTDVFKGQIELDKKGYIITTGRIANENLKSENSTKIENLKMKISKFDPDYPSMTSAPGVFAAGDCVDHLYRQAATAVGMGVAAALEAEKFFELSR